MTRPRPPMKLPKGNQWRLWDHCCPPSAKIGTDPQLLVCSCSSTQETAPPADKLQQLTSCCFYITCMYLSLYCPLCHFTVHGVTSLSTVSLHCPRCPFTVHGVPLLSFCPETHHPDNPVVHSSVLKSLNPSVDMWTSLTRSPSLSVSARQPVSLIPLSAVLSVCPCFRTSGLTSRLWSTARSAGSSPAAPRPTPTT